MTPLAHKLARDSSHEAAAVQTAYLQSVYRGQLRRRAAAVGLNIKDLTDTEGVKIVAIHGKTPTWESIETLVEALEQREKAEAAR